MAFKKMENSNYYILRVNELLGKDIQGVKIKFPANIIDAYEVNGQEKRVGGANFSVKELKLDISHYAIKSYAIKLAATSKSMYAIKQSPVKLPYNVDAFSFDSNRDDGNLDGRYSMPAELIPNKLLSNDVLFEMGSKDDEKDNAVICKGQNITLPEGDFNAIYLLAAATDDTVGHFMINGKTVALPIQYWSGYIGQYYNRNFEQDEVTVKNINAPFIKKDNIAWFASHRHLAYPSENRAYEYSYIFRYKLDLPENVRTITLPNNKSIRIFAITAVKENASNIKSLQPLYDDFRYGRKIELR